MIKVHVLKVDQNPENIAEMAAGVATGRTVDDWQMPKGSQSGDLVIWYAAGHRKYMAGDRWMPTSIPRLPGTYCWPRQSRTLYRVLLPQ